MHLFVSDLHLGRPGGDDRADGAALVRLLDAHADAAALCIVGDLFDAWIEHRHYVPRPPARLFGALAAWTDAGRRLVVHAGNHDPWHRSYLRDELGADVVFDGCAETVEGETATARARRVYAFHGDGLASGGLYRRLRPVLRHRVPVALYQTLLPADAGLALARRVADAIRHDNSRPGDESFVLADAAARLADRRDPVDGVVYGHTHRAEVRRMPGGLYANAGAWYGGRGFVTADADGLALARWTDAGADMVAREAWG